MPKRQRGDDFGLNFQTGKGRGAEIQTNFYVVILIEITANELSFADVAVRHDDDIPIYGSFESPLASAKLDLRYAAVVLLVEVTKLLRVPGRQCQRGLHALSPPADGDA